MSLSGKLVFFFSSLSFILNVYVTGKKGIVCSKGIGEVAGTSEGSPGEKTGQGNTEMHAGFGDSTSQSSYSKDPNGVRRKA